MDDWMTGCMWRIYCGRRILGLRPQESIFKDMPLNIDYEDSQGANTDSAEVNFCLQGVV